MPKISPLKPWSRRLVMTFVPRPPRCEAPTTAMAFGSSSARIASIGSAFTRSGLQPLLEAALHHRQVGRPPVEIDDVRDLLVVRIGRHELGDLRLEQVEGFRILR